MGFSNFTSLMEQFTEGVGDVIWMHADHPLSAFFLSGEPSHGRLHLPAGNSFSVCSKVLLV